MRTDKHENSRIVILLLAILQFFFLCSAGSAQTVPAEEASQVEYTRSILLFTKDIEALDWPRIAKNAGLTTIAIHPGGGHLKATMIQDTIEWIESDVGRKFLADCKRNGIHVEYEVHALRELLPRSLFDKHPTYFRVNKNGNRTTDLNFCVHSQEALEIISRNAIDFSRVCKPTSSRYFFWLDDKSNGHCHCKKCRDFSPSEQALIYENHLLKKLREFDSKATLSHLCYNTTLKAPRLEKVRPLDGVFLEFAPISRRYDKGYRHQWGTKNGPNFLIENLDVFPRHTAQVLEYWMDISKASDWKRPFKKLPWNQKVFDDDLKYYRSLGIRHVASFGNGADSVYLEQYGRPPVKEYGSGLMKNFSRNASAVLIPKSSAAIQIDGVLNEGLYKTKPLASLTVAGEKGKTTSRTDVWVAWDGDNLVISFLCEDATSTSAPQSSNEHDLDGQDRVELFFWNGKRESKYSCVEIGRKGAVHDYSARFYRDFKDNWSLPKGCVFRVEDTSNGYIVETKTSKRALLSMTGMDSVEAPFWLGLFRADFDKKDGKPTWITWRDHGGKPDFHIPEAFEKVKLPNTGMDKE